MQENLKQDKRSKALNIIAICLLLVLFTASIFLAVIAPVFTCKVASAADVTLPDDGVVGDNIIVNSRFTNTGSNISYSGSVANFIKGWSLVYGSVTWTEAGYLSHTNGSGNWQGIYFDFVNAVAGQTYTFTVRGFSSTSNWGLYTYNYPSSGNRVSLGSVTSNTSDLTMLSVTFTVPSDFNKIRLFVYGQKAKGNFTLHWSKLETGSSFTGYVPDYQNQIKDLQDKFDDFVSETNFSYLSTVSLENAYYFNQNVPERSGTSSYTFGPNASDNSLPEVDRNFTCPVNGFYSNTIYRRYLFGVQLPYAVPAGSTIKLNYTCFCVGASFTGVPFSELWRLGYTYAFFFGQYGYPTIDEPGQMLVVDSFNNANGDIYVKVNQPTSYIAFDVVSKTDNSQRLSGYFSVSDKGVFSLHNDSSLGHQWFLAFNALNVYYQGDMLAAAVDSAKKDGYNKGYQEGKVAGREVGYQEGIKDQGDYTFMGLLGAVFDAPIQAFKGLLSFEVLGVNMTAFVSSLFGLAVILLIIKLVLGGK